MENVRFSLETQGLMKHDFGSDFSSFGAKTVKRSLHQDYDLAKNYLTLQIPGKRWFQPKNARLCETWIWQ